VYFLLQWATPWILIVLISTLGQRPVLQDRYLALSQFSLSGFFGIFVASSQSQLMRLVVGANLIGCGIYSSAMYVSMLPREVPAIVQAVKYLSERYRPGDLVIVPDPRTVNIARYYVSSSGINEINLRCPIKWHDAQGHVNHISSLRESDLLWNDWIPSKDLQRIWTIDYSTGRLFPGWRAEIDMSFTNQQTTWREQYQPTTVVLKQFCRTINADKPE
jgi:hypothetical protein